MRWPALVFVTFAIIGVAGGGYLTAIDYRSTGEASHLIFDSFAFGIWAAWGFGYAWIIRKD